MTKCLNISDIATIAIKNVDYCYTFYDIKKSEATNLSQNSVPDDRGYKTLKIWWFILLDDE